MDAPPPSGPTNELESARRATNRDERRVNAQLSLVPQIVSKCEARVAAKSMVWGSSCSRGEGRRPRARFTYKCSFIEQINVVLFTFFIKKMWPHGACECTFPRCCMLLVCAGQTNTFFSLRFAIPTLSNGIFNVARMRSFVNKSYTIFSGEIVCARDGGGSKGVRCVSTGVNRGKLAPELALTNQPM